MGNLTNEEQLAIINETKKLVEEYNILAMDIEGLKDQISRIGLVKRATSPEYFNIYKLMERKITLKSRRLLCIAQKIENNKRLLGISIDKKKKKKK